MFDYYNRFKMNSYCIIFSAYTMRSKRRPLNLKLPFKDPAELNISPTNTIKYYRSCILFRNNSISTKWTDFKFESKIKKRTKCLTKLNIASWLVSTVIKWILLFHGIQCFKNWLRSVKNLHTSILTFLQKLYY